MSLFNQSHACHLDWMRNLDKKVWIPIIFHNKFLQRGASLTYPWLISYCAFREWGRGRDRSEDLKGLVLAESKSRRGCECHRDWRTLIYAFQIFYQLAWWILYTLNWKGHVDTAIPILSKTEFCLPSIEHRKNPPCLGGVNLVSIGARFKLPFPFVYLLQHLHHGRIMYFSIMLSNCLELVILRILHIFSQQSIDIILFP